MKLRSMVDKLEGKAATSRGLDRLENWKDTKSCARTEQFQAQEQTGHGPNRR